ncbi:MAG: transcriptional regulator, CopG family [Pedosphaera sp.]|nr:transcriptional regulator, CopG family [Pedosphaera sp.]
MHDRFDSGLVLRYFWAMQTTIQLDDALLAQATKLAHEKGYDLSHLIEETLRDKLAPAPTANPRPFLRLTTVGGEGVRPGVDLNNSAALLALMEQGA